jgi:hypothetical protein
MQLAVDTTSVYFVFGGALNRVPIRGGSVSTMLPLFPPNVIQNNDPIATSTSVLLHHVVVGNNNERIVSAPKQGGEATTLATSNGQVVAFTGNEKNVYFVDQSGIKSAPTAGGSVTLLTDQIGAAASGLAIVGPNLVVTQSANGSGAVLSVPLQGGPATTLATQQPNNSFPIACGSDVCWWTGAPASAMGPTGPGYMARLTKGNVTRISAPVYPWSIAFDGSSFFETVGCDLCPGTLVRIPLSGAPQVTMTDATFVAVDDECVYFSEAISGSGIYSVEKSYAEPLADR